MPQNGSFEKWYFGIRETLKILFYAKKAPVLKQILKQGLSYKGLI